MMQVTAATYTSAAEMMAAARAVRLRILSAGRRMDVPKTAPTAPAAIIQVDFSPRPAWMTSEITFSAHVEAWQLHVAQAANPVTAYLKSRCAALGISFADMMAATRGKKRMTEARALLMWEVRTKFPDMSFPKIGRIFGRDHTSVLHAFKKIEATRGMAQG